MPNLSKYNLTFKPESYFNSPESNFSRIKGELRRRFLKELKNPEDVSLSLFDESLPEIALQIMGDQNPSLLGGEYLPDCEVGEVEIARIILDNTTTDVISIRAQMKDKLEYKVVDEDESNFIFNIPQHTSPFTFQELITFIESIRREGELNRGITNSFRDYDLYELPNPEEEIDFVKVTSLFYHELEKWYHDESLEYFEQLKLNKGKLS